jgi:hypothetical protein
MSYTVTIRGLGPPTIFSRSTLCADRRRGCLEMVFLRSQHLDQLGGGG